VTLRCPFNTWHHIISRVVCQSISFHVRLKRRPANCLLTSHYITLLSLITITNTTTKFEKWTPFKALINCWKAN
jgi:hypothetical protein